MVDWGISVFIYPFNLVLNLIRVMGSVPEGTSICFLGNVMTMHYNVIWSGQNHAVLFNNYQVDPNRLPLFDYLLYLVLGMFIYQVVFGSESA